MRIGQCIAQGRHRTIESGARHIDGRKWVRKDGFGVVRGRAGARNFGGDTGYFGLKNFKDFSL